MSVNMTERQLRFFRELLAPFPRSAYFEKKGGNGRVLTYIKKRTIENRLDDVVGPLGWAPEYTETNRGYKCRLKIMCPDHTPDGWAWHYKEDGGGFEDMGSYGKDGEWETDTDNDEKSAYTNALRRAAAAWGFGRELYREGVPGWLADLFGERPVPNAGEQKPLPPGHKAQSTPEPTPQPAPKPAPKPEPQAETLDTPIVRPGPHRDELPPQMGEPPRGQRERNFLPPTKPGKAMYAWLKKLGDHFNTDVLGRAISYCKSKGWPIRTDELDEDQIARLGSVVVSTIKAWDSYDGEFEEGYVQGQGGERKREREPAPSPAPSSNGNGHANGEATRASDPLMGLKKSILAQAKSIVMKKTGREPVEGEVMACIGELAASSKSGAGHIGEVLESLRECGDKTWLSNILKTAMKEIESLAQVASVVGDELDDIPF